MTTFLSEAKEAYNAGMEHWDGFCKGDNEDPKIPEKYDTDELRHWFAKGAVHMGKIKGDLTQEGAVKKITKKPGKGRPRLVGDKRKDTALFARIGHPLKKALQDAADNAGRTLSMETLSRLERSFVLDDLRTVMREELELAFGETENQQEE